MTRSGQRERLERLCRYALRPPLAQERLRVRANGTIRLTLQTTVLSALSCGEGLRTGVM